MIIYIFNLEINLSLNNFKQLRLEDIPFKIKIWLRFVMNSLLDPICVHLDVLLGLLSSCWTLSFRLSCPELGRAEMWEYAWRIDLSG